MNNRPLVPSFLKKLDDRLLRNKPTAWSARTHLVVWFTLLFGAVLSLFCYLAFFDSKEPNSMSGWTNFVGLLSFIGLVFWLIFLLRFNVFKRFGNWFVWDGLKGFGLYFISIGCMVAVCFIPSAIETSRANQQFGNEEIVNDINEINVNACKLEYGQLPLQWYLDTCRVVNKLGTQMVTDVRGDTVVMVEVAPTTASYRYIDTAELRVKIYRADSLIKIADSLYVFYTCPDYVFVDVYEADEHSAKKVMTSKDIYYSAIKNYRVSDRAGLLKRMEALKSKYATKNGWSYYSDSYPADWNYERKIIAKYALDKMDNGLSNIVRKKYVWLEGWQIFLRVFYYATLLLTLLVFIFRHTTIKTFFLSALTAVVLMIFTGLMLVMSRGDETSILSFLIFYYVIFLLLALSIYSSKVQNMIQGIGLNLCLLMTPFVPLIFVALKYLGNDRYDLYQRYDPYQKALSFLIAEIIGSVILLVLLEPFFRKLYRKWYSAPDN